MSVCGSDSLAWFLNGKKRAYITSLSVYLSVTHFSSLSNVFQAGQMGGDLRDTKIVCHSF